MKNVLPFLIDLSLNNNRDWFQANKPRYVKAYEEFGGYVDELIAGIAEFDPSVNGVTARDCLFRIYRDVRFSKDKSPYKTHFGAYIAAGGRKSPAPGCYIHFDAIQSFVAGGKHMPDNDELLRIRTLIAERFEEFSAIVDAPAFRKTFGALSDDMKLRTAPKGFPKDHPAAEFLKLKSFTVFREIEPEKMGDRKLVLKSFEAMKPFLDFLKKA